MVGNVALTYNGSEGGLELHPARVTKPERGGLLLQHVEWNRAQEAVEQPLPDRVE